MIDVPTNLNLNGMVVVSDGIEIMYTHDKSGCSERIVHGMDLLVLFRFIQDFGRGDSAGPLMNNMFQEYIELGVPYLVGVMGLHNLNTRCHWANKDAHCFRYSDGMADFPVNVG